MMHALSPVQTPIDGNAFASAPVRRQVPDEHAATLSQPDAANAESYDTSVSAPSALSALAGAHGVIAQSSYNSAGRVLLDSTVATGAGIAAAGALSHAAVARTHITGGSAGNDARARSHTKR